MRSKLVLSDPIHDEQADGGRSPRPPDPRPDAARFPTMIKHLRVENFRCLR